MKNKKALLVIDMQKGSFTEKTPRFDSDGVIERINKLTQLFRALNFPVIFIQHDGSGSGEFEKNTTEWENLDELDIQPNDINIDKYANDVFYNSELQNTLSFHKINELIITGCATDFCVESTIQSALTKDYHITVIEDGHTTGERPQLSAKQVINHYNWVWKNMIPTKGKIQVKKAEELEKII
ncbi:isochorismatase family protein [uncultured Tenacibaculum sp.]|uniref:isochorismatase family protein n=1 Tax=uncultured Tenacibaculum sp. TaxID=174713 RepID=UPI0026018367|nr:isochorismatase family protein [uncultured Tenacibaculum sp.]